MNRCAASRIAVSARIAVATAVLLGSAPAAAEQARAVMSVTAVVAPACSVAINRSARSQPAIACSTGAAVSTMTAGDHDDQPLAEAEALLGAPVRRGRAIVFTASPAVQLSDEARTADASGTRYLTVTY